MHSTARTAGGVICAPCQRLRRVVRLMGDPVLQAFRSGRIIGDADLPPVDAYAVHPPKAMPPDKVRRTAMPSPRCSR